MIWLSELLIEHHELETFAQLIALIKKEAAAGAMQFNADVKPPFPDTPDNWQDRLEMAFSMTPNSF
ncbi:MAG: sulfur relay protein DsrC [bacterium]